MPVGYTTISSNAHGSRRSAIHGRPSARETLAPASMVSYGDAEAKMTSISVKWDAAATTPPFHQLDHASRSFNHRCPRALQTVCVGSGPATRTIRVSSGISALSASSAGVQRSSVELGPVTTVARQPYLGRYRTNLS